MGPWFRFSYTEVNKTGACIRQSQHETKGDEGYLGPRGDVFIEKTRQQSKEIIRLTTALSDRLVW